MSQELVDLLLIHGLIVTQDDHRQIIDDGAIAIKDGWIVAIGPSNQIVSRVRATETVDVTDQVVFPGLIDTHTHLFQVATKGLGEDMPVHEWVKVVTAPTATQITPEEMYQFCLTGCLEHIHCGVTSIVDMSYMAHSYSLHESNIQAVMDSGIRGRYSSIISDFGEEFGVLPELIKPINYFIDHYSRLHKQYPNSDRMAIWIAIGAPWTITDPGLKATMDYADQSNSCLVMHINENWIDNQLSQKMHGKNIVPFLADVGFLRPDLLAIHCVYHNDEDIRLFADHKVRVSYNPVSNMYLGSGIAPIMKMNEAGMTIGLGVDGAGSNNSQDMIESMKVAALLQKVAARDASVVDAQKVLDWATLGGAKVLGLEKEIGSLEEGKRADLFVMANNSAKVTPVHDPVTTLVYSAGEENIEMTIADGKILMRDGIIQHIDEQSTIRACQRLAACLADRCGSNSKLIRHYRQRRTDGNA